MSIDRFTASNIIKHLLTTFINLPENKKYGEAACILWILIWAAQETKSSAIHLKQVINITSQDIDLDDPVVKLDGIELNIS